MQVVISSKDARNYEKPAKLRRYANNQYTFQLTGQCKTTNNIDYNIMFWLKLTPELTQHVCIISVENYTDITKSLPMYIVLSKGSDLVIPM